MSFAQDEVEFYLNVYDLSYGLADTLSEGVLGSKVEGFWHTSVAVYGFEYYYGYRIEKKKPEDFEQVFGRRPTKSVFVNTTSRSMQEFEHFISSAEMQQQFKTSKYHVFNNNCNHFARAALNFLMSDGMLSEIESGPRDITFSREIETILTNTQQISESPTLRNMNRVFGTGVQVAKGLVDKVAGDLNNPETRENTEKLVVGFLSNLINSRDKIKAQYKKVAKKNNASPAQRFQALSNIRRISANRRDLRNIPVKFDQEYTGTRTRRTRRRENPGRDLAQHHPSLAALRHQSQIQAGFVEHTGPMSNMENGLILFLENSFDPEREGKVMQNIITIFEQHDLVKMEDLRKITQQELIQMGIDATWAKRLVDAIRAHFAAPTLEDEKDDL
eukprot:maker-scaffold_4-snap-gene-15.2-mRNA-1 protein AED:0.30 eAED:0.30 QI:178/1/1/1/0.5/0.33/3/143/387